VVNVFAFSISRVSDFRVEFKLAFDPFNCSEKEKRIKREMGL